MSRVPTTTYLLLGEAPNAATAHRPDLWLLPDDSGIPHTANRLLSYTGWDLATYLRVFARRDNLVHHLPERRGAGRAFPLAVARAEVPRVFAEWDGPIVVLGMRAAGAFRWCSWNDLAVHPRTAVLHWREVWSYDARRSAAVVPHPSGSNRWWNDPRNRAEARWFFDRLLDLAP